MHRNHQQNILFVKTLIDDHAPEERVQMYRWLASVADSKWVRDQFMKLANDLEVVEDSVKQFTFSLSEDIKRNKRRKDGNGNGGGQ